MVDALRIERRAAQPVTPGHAAGTSGGCDASTGADHVDTSGKPPGTTGKTSSAANREGEHTAGHGKSGN